MSKSGNLFGKGKLKNRQTVPSRKPVKKPGFYEVLKEISAFSQNFYLLGLLKNGSI